jgi:hypothetical protein
MEIFNTNDSFVFEKLVLTKPILISGGNYFIRCLMNSQPLYIQPPKCKTRQGIVKAGKRLYSDLMFTNENEDFIRWMENLENYCQQYIYRNREKWFEGEMELHDIENYFTSPLKLFKSGKYYISRTNITTVLGKPTLKIYDEGENEIDFETINEDTNVMTILEIQGIKCSAKSFQIEVELKQMMVLQPADIFEKCIITPSRIVCDAVRGNVTLPLESTTFVGDLNQQSCKTTANKVTNELESPTIGAVSNLDDIIETAPIVGERINFGPVSEPEDDDIVITIPKESEEDSPIELISQADDSDELPQIAKEIDVEIAVQSNDEDYLEEVDFNLEELTDSEPLVIRKRDNIYYEMYKEAKKKARNARDLALSAYLEAKRIKNTYMLEDIEDESDDSDESEGSDESDDSGSDSDDNDEDDAIGTSS